MKKIIFAFAAVLTVYCQQTVAKPNTNLINEVVTFLEGRPLDTPIVEISSSLLEIARTHGVNNPSELVDYLQDMGRISQIANPEEMSGLDRMSKSNLQDMGRISHITNPEEMGSVWKPEFALHQLQLFLANERVDHQSMTLMSAQIYSLDSVQTASLVVVIPAFAAAAGIIALTTSFFVDYYKQYSVNDSQKKK